MAENVIPLLMDMMEPEEIGILIGQSVPVTVTGLNFGGMADYLWFACDGHRIQVERKQISEILGGMDHVEEQLSREMKNGVEETILLIEGVCEPIASKGIATQAWHKASQKNIMIPGHTFNTSYTGMQAWKSQLDKAGVTVVETFDYIATAMTLVALYQNSQKPEHKTLKRYIKDRIQIENRNPQILTLMGIKGGGVGEETASALVERYGTVWYILNQSVEDLAETLVGNKRLGTIRARKLLSAVGRNTE